MKQSGIPVSSLKEFHRLRKIHTLGTKIFKNLKILSKNYYNWRNKNVDHHPINSRNYAAAYYETFEEVPGPLLPEKNKT